MDLPIPIHQKGDVRPTWPILVAEAPNRFFTLIRHEPNPQSFLPLFYRFLGRDAQTTPRIINQETLRVGLSWSWIHESSGSGYYTPQGSLLSDCMLDGQRRRVPSREAHPIVEQSP